MSNSARKNRLANETSPYLLQHAENPVDWYPWSEEALAAARAQDKPILLSIGYSACHWCHVMAHESFEDEQTAQVMNDLFINIKVDREERPDLDKIYQTAQQILTQRTGGWPLTMFLTARDQVPFFGGTYFPREARYGMPAFKEVLTRVAEHYRTHKEDIARQSDALIEVFDRLDAPPSGEVQLDAEPLNKALQSFSSSFDREWGGFSSAPKFPQAANLDWLLRRSQRNGGEAFEMVSLTLRKMAHGGIYDHLGGGFCRYSVDRYWMIPHFEKMLYDNGPLLGLFAQCFALTGDGLYRRIAHETADWVIRDMQSPEGGYYSTLDADSEGEEGKFYVWSAAEVDSLVTPEQYQVLALRFGLDRDPNFEAKSHHFHVFTPLAEVAAALSIDVDQAQRLLDEGRKRLLAVRNQRVWPGRDEKILTSWNGLMIRGMAIAARYLQRPDLTQSAEKAADFVRGTLWQNGRLLATYKDGRARLAAYLDDYAFLADGLLALLASRWRREDLEWAQQLADVMLDHFEDREHGGFYFVADDHESLISRPKTFGDDATPSGNGIAAQVLIKLGHLLGEARYLVAAERALTAGWESLERYPSAHGSLLTALDEYLSPGESVILRGSGPELADWHRLASAGCRPDRITLAIPEGASDLPGALAQRAPRDGIVAYICRGSECSAPVSSAEEFERLMKAAPARG